MQIPEKLPQPCQPRVVALLMNALQQPRPSLRQLNQLLGSDPVLAGWLLGHANAGVYQLSGNIQTIAQAVALLGVAQLRGLLKKAHASITERVPGLEQWGPFSARSARRARSLAMLLSLDAGAAYAAALLHAVGQLVLHENHRAAMPALAQQAGTWDPQRAQAEQALLGVDTYAASAALLRHWGVPAALLRLLDAMQQPLDAPDFEPLAAVLHLAVWTERAYTSRWPEREMVRCFPIEMALAVGLDMDVVLQHEATDWSRSMY